MTYIPPEQYYPSLPRKYGSSGLLVPCDGKYVLMKKIYGNKDFTIPGGVCELGESPAETAIREAKEEINLNLEIDRLANICYYSADKQIKGRGDGCHFIFFSKPITLQQYNSIKLNNDEISDVCLKSKEEIIELNNESSTTLLRRVCWALDGELYSENENHDFLKG
jgi:8-oxo-dGTP pyrophosphatase MutT (NUDIX family)